MEYPMSKLIAKVIGIRPQTNAKDGNLFWNIGFRLEEPISVATGIGEDGKPIMESSNTFSMASDTEFPEETLGKWYSIDGLSLRVAVDEDGTVIRHAGVGDPCVNADRGRLVKFTRLEEQGLVFE
jgi:hypothetical protein